MSPSADLFLTPTDPSHFGRLYELCRDPIVYRTWRMGGPSMDTREFEMLMTKDIHLQYSVVVNGAVQGLVRTYGTSPRDQTSSLAGFMAPNLHQTGVGIKAFGTIIEQAFNEFPVRKIYLEANRTAVGQYRSVLDKFAEVEGTLREHQWVGGHFEDVVIAAIFRAHWMTAIDRFRSRLPPIR
ncbi:MAG: GNAT family protein [Ilumatobacter sp.]|uniref:GNAT family N-acetyltransferase n=1 Tax=Ilumatobacter sp. TaxID=1967498 RepID=UPI00261799D1|nr:GNAT family protein [Ilumatobacter sp.]MDJ0769381.1 GNAT family protein [Ilumatobacter sp.]